MPRLARQLTLALLAALAAMLCLVVLLWMFWRPGMDTYQARLADTVPPHHEGVTVRFAGVSAVLVSDGQTAIFIDPFFSRPGGLARLATDPDVAPDAGRIAAGLAAMGVSRLDAVAVSHSHYDHAMDAGIVALITGATLVGSASTLNIGRGAGLPERRLRDLADGRAFDLGAFSLRMLRSRHAGATGGRPRGDIELPLTTPAPLSAYRQGGTFSIVIAHPTGTLLHHGSAGWEDGHLGGVDADTVLLGVALIDDLERYLDNTVRVVGAGRVFPVHWDDFTRPLDRPMTPMPFVVRLDSLFRRWPDGIDLVTLPLYAPVAAFD